VLYANPAAVALFGRGDALVGSDVMELVHPAERATVIDESSRARLHEPLRYEFTTLRPDGSARRVAVSTSPLRELGDAGPTSGVVASVRDVTDERAAQEAARLWTERYARLFEAASDGIVTVDAAGRVTSANTAVAAAAGLPASGLVGRRCTTLVDPRDGARLEGLVAAALDGRRVRGEVRYRDGRGRPRVASVTAAPVAAVDGARAALGILRDVTEERRTAEQAVQREKLAAMGQLVSGVAHELNNPLAGVLAISELLLGEPLIAGPPDAPYVVEPRTRVELRELAAATHREARRAARTVSRLLDFARQHAPRRTAADVNRALVDALDLRRSALRLAGVDLALDLDYELPVAWADAHQLQQVFLNLIVNAEYALAGHDGVRRLTLRTRVIAAPSARAGAPSADASPHIAVEVCDSGPGLAPGEATRVFEPFYTTKPDGAGTGLGLAVSAGIVREHGGTLRAESGPGAGATFIVELPAAAAADLLAAGAAADHSTGSGAA
jgi:PAS domain S-box-containing protein